MEHEIKKVKIEGMHCIACKRSSGSSLKKMPCVMDVGVRFVANEKHNIRHVTDVIELSQAAFRKLRRNLFFAFIYNILGIPLTAFGLLNPIMAGAAMALSSLCIVTNSLSLNPWEPGRDSSHYFGV